MRHYIKKRLDKFYLFSFVVTWVLVCAIIGNIYLLTIIQASYFSLMYYLLFNNEKPFQDEEPLIPQKPKDQWGR